MKVLVISDSHGNITNLKHVLGFAERIKPGAFIHCGDWDNLKAVRTVFSLGIPVYSILGNADIDPNVEKCLSKQSKKFTRTFLVFDADNKKIGVVHRLTKPEVNGLAILFFGHTHRREEKVVMGIKVVNPGALEKEISFVIYDTQTNEVEFIGD